jgi:molybdate transport system ATP-binding protein
MSTITISDLNVDFDEQFQLHGINWTLQPDEHWVVLGANGAGKSALAATLAGAGAHLCGTLEGLPPHVAIVSFEAQAELIEAERKKDDADLLDIITDGTSVAELLARNCRDAPLQRQLIEDLGIGHLLERGFRKLSSGETRKMLLIDALASRPDLLVLDDPFEGVDAQSLEFLQSFLADFATTTRLVIVLNRFDEIPSYATHLAYVEHGHLRNTVSCDDGDGVKNLSKLLHLKTTDLRVPPPDHKPKRPVLAADEPLVHLRDARVAYGDKVIFEGLDWRIHPGEHCQVTGPNGSGKTCLLNLITGDHPQCYTNNIRVFGMQRGCGESIWDIKQYIGYVSSALQWEYKVSVSVRNAVISGFYDSIGLYQKFTELQGQIADQWLALLGMTAFANKPFAQLSFGDQRLVLIARAMVKHPPLLILDEPCLALDDLNRQLVLALIERICSGSETTVLYVNHRPADRIAGINSLLALDQLPRAP